MRSFHWAKGAAHFPGFVVVVDHVGACGLRVVAGTRSCHADGLRSRHHGDRLSAVLAALAGRDGRSRRHAPDFFARRADGGGVVVDVRPDDRIPAEDAEVFRGDGAGLRPGGLGVPAGGHDRSGAAGERAVAVALPASAVPPGTGGDGAAGGVRGGPCRCWPAWRRPETRSRSCRWPTTCCGGRSWAVTCRSCWAGPRWRGGCRRGDEMTGRAGAGGIRAGDRVVIDGRPRVVLGASGTTIRFAGDDGAVEEARGRGAGGQRPAAAAAAGDGRASGRAGRAGRPAAGGGRAGAVVGGPHHRGRGRDPPGCACRDTAASGL